MSAGNLPMSTGLGSHTSTVPGTSMSAGVEHRHGEAACPLAPVHRTLQSPILERVVQRNRQREFDMTHGNGARFTTTARPGTDGPVLAAAGDLDLASAPLLSRAIEQALDERPSPSVLTVDLAGVAFCDSAGLNALLTTRTRARNQSTEMRLAAPCEQVLMLLEMTGADALFPLEPAGPANSPS